MHPFRKSIISFLQPKSEPVKSHTKKRPSGALDTTTPVDRVKMEMKTLVDAVEEAVYPSRPDRRNLITIYENAVKDAHVISQMQIAEAKLIGESFMISRGGVEDPELTSSFKKPWFEEFLKCCFEAELWGYTLVEFGIVKNGDWSEVTTFLRRHVEPYSREILVRPGDFKGIPYGDKPEALFLLEIGKPKDLGLLEIVSREVIWKNFSRTDWSQASEKFGMPLLWVALDSDDEKEFSRTEALCKNFAANGWIVTSLNDKVQLVESAKSDIYKIYEMNARFCDEQISKCINLQTSSSDQKAWVGAAEVQERVLEDSHSARLRHSSNIINYSLFPFLMYHGRDLEGCSFRFPALDPKKKPGAGQDPEKDPEQDPELDPEENKQPAGQAGTVKKKSTRSVPRLPGWVISMPGE